MNTSTEGMNELLYGLEEIDEIRSKIGVFLRTQKLRFVVTRDSGGFSTRLDGFESLAIRCSSLVPFHGGFNHDGDDDHHKTGRMAMEVTLEQEAILFTI